MRFLGLYIAVLCLLGSCSQGYKYAQTVTLPDSCWTDQQNAVFEFATMSAVEASEVEVFIHADIQFSEPFARLTVKTIDPDGLFWEDNIDIARTDNSMSLRTSAVVLRRNIRWAKQGNYAISIRPRSPLYGVRAVGVNISNVINKPKKIKE